MKRGVEVPLSTYFNRGKPVLLALVYYACPNLCNFILNGLTGGLRSLNWTAGKEFDIVAISINPKETGELAKAKKAAYLKEYGRLGYEVGWHFLTGEESKVKAVAEKVGFHYFYDEQSKEYAHSAGIFVLTPTGQVSRVLYGIDFPNRNLKLSLMEASDGKLGSAFDRFLMFCYKYDPSSRGYGFYALRVVQAGGVLTMVLLAGWLLLYWTRERRRQSEERDVV